MKNVFAQVEYVSSPYLRSYFDRINSTPIPYVYDECSVLYRSLPISEQSIRLDNLKGGNTPDYMFLAITPTAAISGSSKYTSTNFENNQITEISITLNGSPCLGYPIHIQHEYPIWPYYKFYDTIGKLLNIDGSRQHQVTSFKHHIIYAHKFEGEETTQGWIGVNINLDSMEGFQTAYTLGNDNHVENYKIYLYSCLDHKQYKNYNRQVSLSRKAHTVKEFCLIQI